MKSTNAKFGLLLFLAGGISLSSCTTDAELFAGINSNMVTVDAEGSTLITDIGLKSLSTGTDALTADQSDWLKFMREEEKVAHDLYLTLSEYYATTPAFKNIARAEQNHMAAILTVLTSYAIEDPASSENGVFNNADLQALYDTLLEKGKVSLVEALTVGAMVEETDILDLEKVYETNPGDDLKILAEALNLGSRNHLRAFARVLNTNGVVYVPVALSADDYTAIISSGWEKGNALCTGDQIGSGKKYGKGSGKGSGKGFMGGK